MGKTPTGERSGGGSLGKINMVPAITREVIAGILIIFDCLIFPDKL